MMHIIICICTKWFRLYPVREFAIRMEKQKGELSIMKIAIGSDRCGFQYKRRLIEHMLGKGFEVLDVGTVEEIPSDSPYYAAKVGKLVAEGEFDYGVLICATGTGMVIAANKIKGCMCAMGYTDNVTKLSREHNDCNMIAFGQDHMTYEDVERRFDIFISTDFGGKQHHVYRIGQIKSLECDREIELQPVMNEKWIS